MREIKILLIGSTFILLTGCANYVQLTYLSDPPYADVICGGIYKGSAPVTLKYDIDKEKNKAGKLSTVPCYAVWKNDEQVKYESEFTFQPFPSYSYLVGGMHYKASLTAVHPNNSKLIQAQKYATQRSEQEYRKKLYEQAVAEMQRRNSANITDQLLNNIYQNQQQQINQNWSLLNSIPPEGYTVTPMEPTGPAAVDVYSVRRINDNLYGVQQVK